MNTLVQYALIGPASNIQVTQAWVVGDMIWVAVRSDQDVI